MRKAKVFVALFSLLPLFSAFVYANGPAVELNLWHHWSGVNEEALLSVIHAFEAKNPDVKINPTVKSGEYMDLLQKMIADMAAGNPPPDLFIGGYNLFNYIHSELKPVTLDRLAPSGSAYKAVEDRYLPGMFRLGAVDKDQIGLPFALSNIVLYCNMDILKAAGFGEKDIPRTWDDAAKIGKLIKARTGKYAIGIQKVDCWPDQALIESNGGSLLTPDGQQVAFNNSQAVQALGMWQSLHKSGLAPICTDAELQASFVAGNVAMYLSSCMKLASIKKSAAFTLQVDECPSFGSKPRALPAGGAAILSFTTDRAKKDAVWRFMDFASSPEAMKLFTRTGYLCVTKAVVPLQAGQEAAYRQIQSAVPWFSWPGGSHGLEIDRLYISKRTELIHGDGDIRTALDQLAGDCNKLLHD